MAAISAAAQARVSEGLPQNSLPVYVQHLDALRSLAVGCAAKASACNPALVPPDERINRGSPAFFEVHYRWIRDAFGTAKSLPAAKRASLMQNVEVHLEADRSDAQSAAPSMNFQTARQRTDAILEGREFDTVRAVSPQQQIMARIAQWLDRMLGRVAGFGSRSPWIAPLIEWLLGSLACALLLVWTGRTFRRQRAQMRFETGRPIEEADERVLNWTQAAEGHAAAGQFRDAVHCLYWASIAGLEGRRLWHPDRARTPREYLRLLDPASPASPILRRQTLSFESTWYGLRSADRSDYEQALHLHQQLRTA